MMPIQYQTTGRMGMGMPIITQGPVVVPLSISLPDTFGEIKVDESIDVNLSSYIEGEGELIVTADNNTKFDISFDGMVATISPIVNWTGTETVTFIVTDSLGSHAEDTIDISSMYYTSVEIAALITDGYKPITTAAELNKVRTAYPGGAFFGEGTPYANTYTTTGMADKYLVLNDIDLKEYLDNGGAGYSLWGTLGWLPLGHTGTTTATMPTQFTGIFDGGGYAIDHMSINRSSWMLGLFAAMHTTGTGVIKNIGVTNVLSYNTFTGVNCYSGALIGYMATGTVMNCYGTGTIQGDNDIVGGLIGMVHTAATVTKSYSECTVTGASGTQWYGGFCGYAMGIVDQCYATGDVTANHGVGGFCGYMGGNANLKTNCYSSGNVIVTYGYDSYPKEDAGFCAWNNQGKIKYCYSTGYISWTRTTPTSYTDDRGLCGKATTGADYEMAQNYWDKTTSLCTTSAGTATGLTTEEMANVANYGAGWDFSSVWIIVPSLNGGRPILRWQQNRKELIA